MTAARKPNSQLSFRFKYIVLTMTVVCICSGFRATNPLCRWAFKAAATCGYTGFEFVYQAPQTASLPRRMLGDNDVYAIHYATSHDWPVPRRFIDCMARAYPEAGIYIAPPPSPRMNEMDYLRQFRGFKY